MKKVTKFIAGLSAAAALLLAVGCKNQEDYAEDTTVLNKMNILGLSLKGFTDYNGAKATLYSVEGDKTVTVAVATVAGEYKKDATTTLNLKSGAGYTKLATPYLYDGDAVAKKYYDTHKNDKKFEAKSASKIELYLSVGGDTYQVWKDDYSGKENAKLAVQTSPAATPNSELKGSYVTVTRGSDGVALFTLASSASPDTKSNLYELKADTMGLDNNVNMEDWNKISGVKVEASNSTTAVPKYTVIVKNLKNDIGGKYVVTGAKIGSKVTLNGEDDCWGKNLSGDKDKDLVSTVDKDGTIKFVFYGENPSWDNGAHVSPAWKIAKYGTTKDPWESLLCRTDNGNIFFPDDTKGKDVTLTIDYDEVPANAKNFTAADAETAAYGNITIKSVILKNAPKIGDAGYLAFCEGWMPVNVWDATTQNKVRVLESDGSAVLQLNYAYNYKVSDTSNSFKLQVLNPASDDDFWADASKVYTATDGAADVTYATYKDKTINLVYDATAKTASVEVVQ